MKRYAQSGFALVEFLLGVVALAGVAFTAWYIIQANNKTMDTYAAANDSSNQVIPKTSLNDNKSETCKVASSSMTGSYQVIAKGGFEFCLPNGWVLSYVDSPGSYFASAEDIIYNPNQKPAFRSTGGSDKNYPFVMQYELSPDYDRSILSGYSKIPAPTLSDGDNLKVSAYYHMTGKDDVVGAGIDYLPEGTKQYLYVIETTDQSLGAILQVSYHITPGQTDNLAAVQGVVSSVRLPKN